MANPLAPRYAFRRNLPHLYPAQGTFFVTFNLHGLVAQPRRYASTSTTDRAAFLTVERALHAAPPSRPRWLARPDVADMVLAAILHRHGKVFDLDCVTVMPNHVHMVFCLAGYGADNQTSVSRIMHSLKGYTGHRANRLIGRRGPFWQRESFDRWVRTPEEWRRCLGYVVDNPVKAGLVTPGQAWPWTWCRWPDV